MLGATTSLLAGLAGSVVLATFNTQPVPPPPAPPVEAEQPDLVAFAGQLSDRECAEIRVALGEEGLLSVGGRVGSLEALEALEAEVARKMDEWETVVDADLSAVEVWPQPFCAALDFIADPAVTAGTADGPVILLDRPGKRPVYREGDNIFIRIKSSDTPGHLHVAYFNVDGNVFAILPGHLGNETRLDAPRVLSVGVPSPAQAAPDSPPLTIGKPLGHGLLLAVHAPELLVDPAEPAETAEVYLEVLRERIAALRKAGTPASAIQVDHTILQLLPQEPGAQAEGTVD